MFGNYTEQYASFLKDAGIYEIPVYLNEITTRPFARSMYLYGFDEWVELVLGGLDLSCGQGVRGIRKTNRNNRTNRLAA